MRRPCLVAALALACAACIDFREINRPAPPVERAEFVANLWLGDAMVSPADEPGEPSVLRLNARLRPGRDARGEPRRVRDDTLRVEGVSIAPGWIDDDGTRTYDESVRLPAPYPEDGTVLRLSPPPLADRSGAPQLLLPVPARIGGSTLELAPGEDLRLPVSMPSVPSGTPGLEQEWSLTVLATSGRLLLSGVGAPPAPLVVPAAVLPGGPGRWLDVRLVVNSRSVLGSDHGDYSIAVRLDTTVGWTVRPAAAPAG